MYRAKGDRFKVHDISAKELHDVAVKWVNMQSRTRVIVDRPTYIYAISSSVFLGIPDNIAIRIVDLGQNKSGIEVQAELTVGHGDFYSNLDRVKSLLRYVEAVIAKKK